MVRHALLLLLGGCFTLPMTVRAASIVDETSALETISTDFQLADGPAWDGSWALLVPDVKGQKLYRYIPRSESLQVVLPEAGRISASFSGHGRLYLSDNGESRIAWLDGKKKVGIAGQDKQAKPPARPNDLVADRTGGIYYTLTRQGQVIYIAPGGEQRVAVEKIETPNGLILSPDESTLYVAAYVPKKIWAYDVGPGGKLTSPRVFAGMDKGPEKGADGMSIDRAGNVYCAGPKHVWAWSPAGKLLAKIETPSRPINCTFGDQDMRSLYITGFGGLYRQRMRISGRSPHPPATDRPQPTSSKRPPTTLPPGIDAHLDVVYARYGDRKLLADIFVPNKEGPTPRPAVVVVHGGGWLKGDKTKFRALAIALAARGYVTAAIEYRLGGEANFPAAIQDCHASVRFLRAQAGHYGIDPNRIGAVGGSAGGHLVGLLAATPHVSELQGSGGHADRSSKIQAAIVMAGPMEMASGSVAERSRTQATSNSNLWLGKTIDQAPDLYRLADAYLHLSKKTPPTVFMVGEHDNPQRNQRSREKLKSLGVWTGLQLYEDGKHGCWNQLPWFTDMVTDMDKFFREHLARASGA
ncbi:MAG: SMP-30/gluconolactonase/LRE family protein [Phycisphaerae bacterium]|nr:SMP-30/gluconolactonase/LRE family protein [Phycisphaerae bacterium]